MPPNSALTRFLKQGLKRGVCPLCRVAYKMDGEYMWAFFDDYSSDDKTLDRLREARGFCAEHAERLRRLEVEGLHSNHFELVWDRANPDERAMLLELQRRVVSETADHLQENIRKQGHEYDGEPEGHESESWRRAIYLTAGWEKEALRDDPPERPYEVPHYARVATRNKGKRRAKKA